MQKVITALFAITVITSQPGAAADKENYQLQVLAVPLLGSKLPGNAVNALKSSAAIAAPDADGILQALITEATDDYSSIANDQNADQGDKDTAQRALGTLKSMRSKAGFDSSAAYVLHVVKWRDATHSKSVNEHWYEYESRKNSVGTFSFQSAQAQFESLRIHGKKQLYILGIFVNEGDAASNKSGTATKANYDVTETKKQSQVITDLLTLISLVRAEQRPPQDQLGWFTIATQPLKYSISQIEIQASVGDPAKSSQLTKQTYENEGNHSIGFGAAVPLNSYKDVTYDQTGSLLTPKTIDRQNVYATFDVYFPRVDLQQTQFRYVPHPFFGIPIKNQPLRNTMVGLAIGLNWVEPFVGVAFDVRQVHPAGTTNSTMLENHLVYKAVYGIHIPVSALKKGLSSATK